MENPGEGEMELSVEADVQKQADTGGKTLADYGGVGCSGNPELWEGPLPKIIR